MKNQAIIVERTDDQLTIEKHSHHTTEQPTELIKDLTPVESDLSVSKAFASAPGGVLWSLFICTTYLIVGYLPQVIFSFFALPAFVDKYGTVAEDGTSIITAEWQTALSMSVVGSVFGALGLGWFCDQFGRKLTTIMCGIISIGTVFILLFAPNIQVLTVGSILSGVPQGGIIMLVPLYIGELSPLALRGPLLSFSTLFAISGQLLAQGVALAGSYREDEWAYRMPFAVSWVLCVPIFLGALFIPESPWYLIHKGKRVDARKSLQRLLSAKHYTSDQVDHELDKIEKTALLELKLQASSTWLDLFKGTERRRTEITALANSSINVVGIQFAWLCNYFFTLAGLSTTQAFNLGVASMALGVLGTAICSIVLSYIGRRTLFMTGLVVLALLMLIIGALDVPSSYDTDPRLPWAQSILFLLWNFVYGLTISPLSIVYTGEIPSTKAKTRAVAVATAVNFVASIVVSVALPYMINPDSGNMRGKAGFVFAGATLVLLVWAFFRLPEIGGRTYAEIDYLFEHGVSARKFKKWKVEDLDESSHSA